MSVEDNIETFKQYRLNVMLPHNIARLPEYVTDTVVDHSLAPDAPQGIDGLRQWLTFFFEAFPDAYFSIDDVFGEGDKIVCHARFHGSHQGAYLGLPPTGKTFDTTGIEIMRFENGKMAERWFRLDVVTMMQQLGFMPPPPDQMPGAEQGAGSGQWGGQAPQ
jgi:steroid delta-isomerase-like uncharacterized protein